MTDQKKIIKSISDGLVKPSEKYYNFGACIAGPFLYGFTRWLISRLTERSFDKIFFFSRDGYLMQKAFDCINTYGIRTQYVYFSRNSLRQALLWRCNNFAQSLKYFGDERFISLGTLLQYYGFSEGEREEIAKSHNLDIGAEYRLSELPSDKVLQSLYDELQSGIAARSREQNDLVCRYLAQCGMEGDCAIADIGWHGRMQYYLDELCRINNIPARFYGYYVGVSPISELSSPAYGYLYEGRNDAARKRVLCFFGVLEKLLQSLEGSAAGYKEQNGRVCPVLEPYEYESDEAVRRSITEWQTGACDFIRAAAGRTFDDSLLVSPLLDFGRSPSLKDVKLFSFMYIVDGKKYYFTSQKSLFRYTPREFVHALSNSPWKTGFLKSAFKIPLPYFIIYNLIKK